MVGGLWLVAAVSVLVAVVVIRTGEDEPAAPLPTPDAVRLEPVTYRNPAPFTPSLVTTDVRRLPGRVAGSVTVELPAPTGTVTGDTAHLYASTSAQPVCDKAVLAERLRRDGSLAAAWARGSGIDEAGIDGLLASLTPVVLRADTAVTNHIYSSGESSAYQSVLEAGTPVMVDPTGLPRVQCSCGNPLAAPAAERPSRTDGRAWKTYEPARVVSVAPAAAPLPAITTVDLDTSKPATTATGSNVALDGTLVAATNGLHVATPDGQMVKVLDQQVDVVFDDGKGGLVYTLASPGNPYRGTYPGTEALATIWHLPAGATEAVPLVPPARPGGWNLLESVGRIRDRTHVVFGRVAEEQVNYGEDSAMVGDVVAMDLDSHSESVIIKDSYRWEAGVQTSSFGGDRLSVIEVAEAYAFWSLFGPGPAKIDDRCGSEDMVEVLQSVAAMPCPSPGVLDESGKVVGVDEPDDVRSPATVVWRDPITGEKGRGVTLQGARLADSPTSPEQVRSGRLITANYKDGKSVWREFDLSNGTPVDLPVVGLDVQRLWMLTAPIIRPQAASPGPSEAKPAYRSVTVDELRAGFPSVVCGLDVGPVPIGPEGRGTHGGDPAAGTFIEISFGADQSADVDVDGDGVEETVVAAVCSFGGTSYTTPLAAVRMGPSGIEVVGEVLDDFGRGGRAFTSITPIDGGVEARGDRWKDSDGLCCPSSTFTARFHFVDGRWQES